MILAILLGLIIVTPMIMVTIGILISGPRYKGPVSDHFDGKRFSNPTGVRAKGGMEVLKWMMQRKRGPWTEVAVENYGQRPLIHCREGVRITFVNHSTFLIQVDGLNILTDPVWSKRVSPFRWLGPKRMKLPGIKLEDLPRIHVVLLTHNHYDHLDLPTLRTVFGGHHPRIITPLGMKEFLEANYLSVGAELDWWEEIALDDKVKVQSVPAQHFSGRGFLDRDATLWCGYVIKTSFGNIYFAGDTGYNDKTFKEIGIRCRPIRIAMLPIGAYKPAWFMSPIHVSPEESVKIHLEVGAETTIATHFGTFPLADDGDEDPVNDLRLAVEKYQVAPERFVALKEGEVRMWPTVNDSSELPKRKSSM